MTDVWVLNTEKKKLVQYQKFAELIRQMPTLLAIDAQQVRNQLLTLLSMLHSHITLIAFQVNKAPQLESLLDQQKQAIIMSLRIIEEQARTELRNLDLELLLKQIARAEELSHTILTAKEKSSPFLKLKSVAASRAA